MSRSVRWITLGIVLITLSVFGMLWHVHRLDVTSRDRDVAVRPQDWTLEPGTTVRHALSLGSWALPPNGQLHVVTCPAPAADPHGVLRITVGGRRAPEINLEADENRGNRCFEASYHASAPGIVEASVALRSAVPPAGVHEVEVRSSKRITPWMAWPALTLLVGLLCVMFARRPRDHAIASPPELVFAHMTDAEVIRISPLLPVQLPYSGLLAIGVYVLLHIALIAVAAGYMIVTGPRGGVVETGAFVAVTTVVQHGLMVLAAVWFLTGFHRRDVRDALGLVPVRGRDVARAVLLALALLAVALASTHFIRDVSVSPMGKMIERVPVRYVIGFGALLAPFSEELFFRGVLVPAFGKRRAWVGILASATVFTVAHVVQLSGTLIGLAPIAGVGLVNGWLRARSGGITQSWMVHTLYNGMLSAGLYVTGTVLAF